MHHAVLLHVVGLALLKHCWDRRSKATEHTDRGLRLLHAGQSNLAILGMGTVVGTATGTRIPVVAVVGTATVLGFP